MNTSRKTSGRARLALAATVLFLSLVTLFTAASCKHEPEPEHSHTISEEWSFDNDYHWHAASCNIAEHNADRASHTWDAGVVTTPATELTDGEKKYTCTVCGFIKTEVIPAGHEHTYPDYWSYRQVAGNVQKYKVCTLCTHEVSEAAQYADIFTVDGGSLSVKWIEALERCEIITGEWTIPSAVGEDDVTVIESDAFYGETGLTAVVFPDTVTEIGDEPFYGCTNLVSVSIPASVTDIPYSILSGSNGTAQLTVAEGNPNYCVSDGMLFSKDMTTLVSSLNKGGAVSVPAGVTVIGGSSFCYNEYVTAVVLPDSVTTIEFNAFYGCENLQSISIPAATETIGEDALTRCHALATIQVDAANETFSAENGILYNKDKTILVAYPSASGAVSVRDGVTKIGRSAMYGCSGITSLVLPDSVTWLDHYCFYECTGITSLIIPDSVTKIGWDAFAYCASLAEVTVGVNADKDMSSDIFKGSPAHIIFKSGRTTIPGGFLNGGTDITEVTIPDTVTKICDSALFGCRSLTGITIPDSVTVIEQNAFRGCTGLQSITIPSGVNSIGAFSFTGCTCEIVFAPGRTSIPSGSLDGADLVTHVTVPASVTTISNNAFNNCKKLEQITFGGTQAQWNAITKQNNWKANVPDTCIVKCSDGDIAI